MSVPSDKIERRINTSQMTVIAIPTFLTALVLILLIYLTIIVSNFNHSQTLSACRGKVSQEIQETFRTDISKLIKLAGEAADGPRQRDEQQKLLDEMARRPSYVAEVKHQCGQDLGVIIRTTPKTLPTPATTAPSATSTTVATQIPEE